jgi:hypothetical protein
MRLDNLAKLVPFASLGEIETIIVDAIRHGEPLTCHRNPSHLHARLAYAAAAKASVQV